jgi:hypothetical protein
MLVAKVCPHTPDNKLGLREPLMKGDNKTNNTPSANFNYKALSECSLSVKSGVQICLDFFWTTSRILDKVPRMKPQSSSQSTARYGAGSDTVYSAIVFAT